MSCVEDVLRPRHEEPHDGALLLGRRADDPLGLHAAQQDRPAADEEAAEPVHLRAGVVERRDAEEDVVVRLAVVGLLHLAALGERAVPQDDRLREAGRAGGVVDRRVVVERERNLRAARGAVRDEVAVALGERRAVAADVEEGLHLRELVGDLLDAPDELGAEDEEGGVREVDAVPDLVGGVAEVERDRERARAEDAEVDREPLEAVHEEDRDLVALLHAAREQEVGEAVGLLLELRPGDLGAEGVVGRGRLDERILLPGRVAGLELLGVDLDECGLVRIEAGVVGEDFGNRFHRSARIVGVSCNSSKPNAAPQGGVTRA